MTDEPELAHLTTAPLLQSRKPSSKLIPVKAIFSLKNRLLRYILGIMISIAIRFVTILTTLRQAISAFAAQQNRAQNLVWLGSTAYAPIIPPNQPARLPDETWTLLYHRLTRLAARFTALFHRWQTETLPTPRPARRLLERSETPAPAARFPSTRGWVNHRIPDSAACTGQFEALLQDPEFPKFLADAPQAGRLLRPLCHALGLPEPTWLKRPVKPKPQLLHTRPPKGAPKSGQDAQPPGTPDRPLPPHIRAAARAWRKFDT